MWQEAVDCMAAVKSTPDYARVKAAHDQSNAKLEAADKLLVERKEKEAVVSELAALVKEIGKSTPAQYDAMVKKANALGDRATEIAKRNGMLRAAVGQHFESMAKTLAWAKDRRAEADAVAAEARRRERAVVTQFPELTWQDSFSPARVAEVWRKVPAEDVVVFFREEARGRGRWTPSDNGQPVYDANCDKKDLAYGGCLRWENDYIKAFRDTSFPDGPEYGQLGIVWQWLNDSEAIVVTMDGGRYVAHTSHINNGIVDEARWPAPYRHQFLLPDDVRALAKMGVMPAAVEKKMTDARAAAADCAVKVWNASAPQFDKLAAADIRPDAKRARVQQLNDKTFKQAVAKCDGLRKKYDATWRDANAWFQKEREKTYEVAREVVRKHLAAAKR